MTPLDTLPHWVQPRVKEMLEDLRERIAGGLEAAVRDGISQLERSILHHEIERDGWFLDDKCYQELVTKVVAGLVAQVRALPLPESALEKEPRMCGECEMESRTGTGSHGTPLETCYCPCHGRGDGVAVPRPGYFTPNTCGSKAPLGWERCARVKGHEDECQSADGLSGWVIPDPTPAPAPPVAGEEKGHRCTIINCRERRLQGLRCLLACGCACHKRPAPSPPNAEQGEDETPADLAARLLADARRDGAKEERAAWLRLSRAGAPHPATCDCADCGYGL